MDEDTLVRQLHEIERKLAGDSVGAETGRAELARWREREPDKEFRASVPSPIAQRVLLGWCLRLGLTPYRTPRQRQTTICVRVPPGFMREAMWPRVEAMATLLEQATTQAAQRIVERWAGVSMAQHEPSSQAELFGDP